MRGTAPLALLVLLAACQPATNVRMATESPDGASSKSDSPHSADASPALLQVLSVWELATEATPELGLIEDWHPHAGSGTCLPVSYGDFMLGKVTEYGPNDESLTLVSEVRGTTVTLYVYPGTDALEAEFESVRGSMNQTCGAGVGAILSVDDERFPGGGRIGLCTHMLDDDLEVIEQIVLFSRDGWYYKARATWPAFLSSTTVPVTRQIIAAAFNACPGVDSEQALL